MPIEIRELVVRASVGAGEKTAPVQAKGKPANCDCKVEDLPENVAEAMTARLLERLREETER